MRRYYPHRLRGVVATALALGGLVFCSSAAGTPITETSQAGQTAAVLSYELEPLDSAASNPSAPAAFPSSPSPRFYSDFKLKVSRRGRLLVSDELRPTCRECDIYPGGRQRSVRVRDVTGDGEPEVIVDLNTFNYGPGPEAGAYDSTEVYYTSYVYSYVAELNGGAGGYRRAEGRFSGGYNGLGEGDVTYRLRDLKRDGRLEFVTEDDRFALDFYPPRLPLRIWRLGPRGFENVTKRYPETIARHARRMWRSYLRLRRARRPVDGALAVYMADLYLLGRGDQGWERLRRLARRDLRYPNEVGVDRQGRENQSWQGYLRLLRQILRRTGYAAGDSTAATPGCTSRLVVITKRKAVPCASAKRIFANWASDLWPEDNHSFDCYVTSLSGTAGICENDLLPRSHRFRWRMR
jgi:hypothetical protein